MNIQALKRQQIILLVITKKMRQSKAAEALGISIRQVKRLCRIARQQGIKSLPHEQRGGKAHNRISDEIIKKVIVLAGQKYVDFGPTFLAEKLREAEGIKIGKESVRKILIVSGLWKNKTEKKKSVHQRRERRSCFGELIQIDGSPHAWFEDRGEKCCLILFIDDATSHVVYAQFEPVETTMAYFKGMLSHIKRYGIPLAYYSDKHMIFRITNAKSEEINLTQFERACQELGIEGICANTPQAKGRVERANRTFQDRLVKELRLTNINNIEDGNKFLQTYIPIHNKKFAVCASQPNDVHIKNIPDDEILFSILSIQNPRKLSKNLELSFNKKIYQILKEGKGRRLQQSIVTVCEMIDGSIQLLSADGKRFEYQTKEVRTKVGAVIGDKDLSSYMDGLIQTKKVNKPSKNHPWRRYQLTPPKPHLSSPAARGKILSTNPTQAFPSF